jgi:hypothetical protein
LIINDSLDDGTQLPYIKKAKELGFAVMVFNTNEPYEKGPDGGSPVAHAKKAWRQFVKKVNLVKLECSIFTSFILKTIFSKLVVQM